MVSGFQLVTMCAIIDGGFGVRVTNGCPFDNRLDMLDKLDIVFSKKVSLIIPPPSVKSDLETDRIT